MCNLFAQAHACLMAQDAAEKVLLSRITAAGFRNGDTHVAPWQQVTAIPEPGRPARPQLVNIKHLSPRKLGSSAGHAALIHSIVHIEFNAINLAWDAVYRFRDMPAAYYADWVRVADEEAYHFVLLRRHLQTLGYDYGDFPAHDGLWDMAQATQDDVLLRMAIIPRGMEARGLDVTPEIMRRLRGIGDLDAVAILEIILRDEIGHVAVGTRWFDYECRQRRVSRDELFPQLVSRYLSGGVRKPLHLDARRQAGFSEHELAWLAGGS